MSFKILWEDHIKNMQSHLYNRVAWDENFNSGDYWYTHLDSSSPIADVNTDSSHTTPQTTPWIIVCAEGYAFNRRYSKQGNNSALYRGYLGSTSTVNKQFGTYDFNTHTYTGNKPLVTDNAGKKYYNAMVIATYTNVINSPAIFPGQLYDTPNEGSTDGVWKSLKGDITNIYNSGQATLPLAEPLVIKLNPTTYTITNNLTNCSSNNSNTQVVEGATYKAKITPNTNYNLDSITVTMGGTDVTSSVVTTGNNTYSINITNVTGDIVITASATQQVTYTITNNLTNSSSNNSNTQVLEGDTYTATITPTTDYNLDSITVTMDNLDITSSVVTESNNTYSISIASVTGDVVITASASAIPVADYTITNTLATEITNTNSATTVPRHSSYNAEILTVYTDIAQDDKAFTFKVGTLTVTMGGTNVTSSVVTKVNDWDYTISIADVTGDVVITVTSTQILTEKKITYNIPNSQNNIADLSTHIYTMKGVNRNMSSNMGNNLSSHLFKSPATSGEIGGTKIFIWANEGYGIRTSDVANADITFDFNFVMEHTENEVTRVATYALTKNDILWVGDVTEYYNNGTTAPIKYEGDTYYRGIVIDLESVFNLTYLQAIALYPNVQENIQFVGNVFDLMGGTPDAEFPICYVYNPTYEQLEQVATARYVTPSSATEEGVTIDLSKYIIKVYKTYVDFEVAENPSDVILGNIDSNVSSNVILKHPVIDCGTVTLTEEQQNVLDYSPFAKLEIYLPFIGTKELDIDVIRGKEIKLIYKVNVMSGKCLAVLQYNNIPLYQFEGAIGEDIPFATNTGSVDFSTIRPGSDNPLSMGTNYAYYILTTNKGYAPDKNIDGLAQYESGVIGDYTGYVRVNNVELETSATEDEKRKIENLLKVGVVIEQVPTPINPSNGLYPSNNLYPSNELYPGQ